MARDRQLVVNGGSGVERIGIILEKGIIGWEIIFYPIASHTHDFAFLGEIEVRRVYDRGWIIANIGD